MITLDLSILNQKGTPMFFSDTTALQPNFGIVGRIFIATDSPYGIFRDTGSAWVQIADVGGGGGGITGTGTATQIAFFSAATTLASSANLFWDNTNARLGVNTATPVSSLNVIGNTIISNTLTGITGTSPSALTNSAFSNDFTFNSGISTSASVNTIGVLTDNSLNYSGANTINVTSYNATVLQRNNLTFGTAAASITYTQATGIRALTNTQNQYIQNGANNGTISHYANFQILGDQKTGAGITTFTNRYGILINDFNEFTAGNTYTNRWGIYQAGLNENNFFAGKVGIGSGYSPGTFSFDVVGTARVSGGLTASSATLDGQATSGTSLGVKWFSISGSSGRYIYNSNTNSDLLAFNNGIFALQGNSVISFSIGSFGITATGTGNVAILGGGTGAGSANVSIGSTSALSLTTGSYNVAIGEASLYNVTTNSHNVAIGRYAGTSSGSNATANHSQSIFIGSGTGWLSGGTALTNTTIIGYNLRTNLSNVFMLGRSDQTILIGEGTSVGSGSILQIDSTTKGFLPPRMTTTQKNAIATPAAGLMVYDSTLNKLCVYTTAWETVTSV